MVRDSKSKDTRKKGGLGRGIEALFEDEPQVEETEEWNLGNQSSGRCYSSWRLVQTEYILGWRSR